MSEYWSGNKSFIGVFNGQGHNIYIKKIVNVGYNGFINYMNGGTLQNCNIIFENESNFNNQTGDPVTIGGLISSIENSTVSNCNIIFKNNINFINSGIGTSYIGGLIGSSITGNISNCNIIFGNNIVFNPVTDNSRIGGLIGNIISGGTLQNCNVIFGNNIELLNNGSTCITGGLIGNKAGSVTATNCCGIYKDYKIIGTTRNAVIGSGSGNNCYTLTFGGPIDGNGVQNMLGPYQGGPPTNLENVQTALETSLYSQWLPSLIAIREKLNEDRTPATPTEVLLNNPLYLNNIVGNGEPPLSPDVSLGYKNAALQLSMAYSDTPYINSDFGTIKSLLSTYTTATEFFNGKTIEYLNTPTDNAYTLEKQKFYYIPVSEGTISVDSSTPIPFVTSKSPAGISYQENFISIDEIYNKVGVASFTTYGVGSGLIGIDEPTPVPPTPSTTTEPISWWWVLIVLAVLFIVIGLYIYFFKYDHWFNSNVSTSFYTEL